ncbi:MAG: regulatory protein RecX [Lacisediminihabitans sp.]
MTSGNGLATVSYLPGVLPPTAGVPEPEPLPDSAQNKAATGFRTQQAESLSEDAQEAQESAEEQRDRAEKISMRALTRRGQSRWELRKALLDHKLDEEVVEAELVRLESVGLIDDAALAATLVRTRRDRKGLGRSALTAELRSKHIEQQHIDQALEQVDDDDEQSRASELALRRVPQMHSLDAETAKRRLTGFLLRKGYAGSVVRTAVDEALRSRGGNPSRVQFR